MTSLSPARLALSGLPPKARAVSPTVSRPPVVPHQPSWPPRHDQYEIFELTRIFHTDLLRKPGRQMDAVLSSKSSSGSMYSYSRCQTSSLALPHQPSRPPRHDQYEISGLKLI
ncbi:MAG: hypothetical protein QE493_08170 [Verrucomicrobiae bacterium]|nr:hypothetical protein [Verrucomicrobiae bacterium]